MTTRRRIRIASTALVVVLIAAAVGRSAWRRAQEPKYEGRTASEWLDHLAANGDAAFLNYELPSKEGEAAFRSLGAPGQRYLVDEYLRFEQSKGFRLQFQTLSKRIPDRLRPRFLSSPTDRWIVCGTILYTIRADWEVLTPEVLEAFATIGKSTLRATRLLGWTGRGATNATLLLMQHPTNSTTNYLKFWRQAFDDLGTNTYPALLESLQRLDSSSADDWLLNKISRHGAAASGALPKLNQLFAAALNGTSAKHNFAVALLRIEPNHEGAANHSRAASRLATTPSKSTTLLGGRRLVLGIGFGRADSGQFATAISTARPCRELPKLKPINPGGR